MKTLKYKNRYEINEFEYDKVLYYTCRSILVNRESLKE